MLRKIIAGGAGLVLLTVLVGSAQSSVINISNPNQFFFPGEETTFVVIDYENLNKGAGNYEQRFQVGDWLRGIAKVTASHDTGTVVSKVPNGFELTMLFQTLVTRVDPDAAGESLFEFAPHPAFETEVGVPGAMAVFYYDTSPDFDADRSTEALSEATATDGSVYMVLGADQPNEDWGDMNQDGTGYYWASTGSTTPSVAGFAASIELLVNNTSIPTDMFLGSSTAPPTWPVNFSQTDALLTAMVNEFAFSGNTILNPSGPGVLFGAATSPYVVKSEGFLRAETAIPEPSSLLIFAGLFGCMALGVRHRKRQV